MCLETKKLLVLIVVLLAGMTSATKAQDDLNEHLKPLQPFLGKTWKGEFANSTSEKPIYDVSRWERALNGQAIRILHSVNNGEYGGETIIFWDREKSSLVFYYFTTAGFFTTGTMKFENARFISHEYVKGNQQGITEVKSTSEVLPEGRLHSKSQYFQKGKWVDGHEVFYIEDPTAQVIFK
ncbi:MAG: hypothetical protein ONB44_13320 [candidate division KSB1 bacterium]|nr:hypothetical protein [candidate division KSB1 bacterium]MDZ7303102.1 hypothetical protein [candidate division KSB1 bacterium]MDZ7312641.1 hypothetical protein [candidate division KSB1 bacterium]